MPKKDLFVQLVNAMERKHPQPKRIDMLLSRLLYEKVDLEEKDHAGRTLLIKAAQTGNAQVVNALISAKVSLDVQDNNNDTALIWAVYNQDTRCVYQLIKAGAKLELKNDSRVRALSTAVYNKVNVSIINMLISHGARIREHKRLYDFLMDTEGLKALPSLVALYQDQKLAFDTSCVYSLLNEKEFKHLEKIFRFNKLHHDNIYRSIDEGARRTMPDVLLKLISEYNSPEDNSIEGLKKQNLSFFNHPMRFDSALKREETIEAQLHFRKRQREPDDELSSPAKKIAR